MDGRTHRWPPPLTTQPPFPHETRLTRALMLLPKPTLTILQPITRSKPARVLCKTSIFQHVWHKKTLRYVVDTLFLVAIDRDSPLTALATQSVYVATYHTHSPKKLQIDKTVLPAPRSLSSVFSVYNSSSQK